MFYSFLFIENLHVRVITVTRFSCYSPVMPSQPPLSPALPPITLACQLASKVPLILLLAVYLCDFLHQISLQNIYADDPSSCISRLTRSPLLQIHKLTAYLPSPCSLIKPKQNRNCTLGNPLIPRPSILNK